MTITTFNEDQIEQMRFIVNQADQLKARQASYDRLDYCNALTPILQDKSYLETYNRFKELQQNFKDDGFFSHHVDTLLMILETLENQVNLFNSNTKASLEQQRMIDSLQSPPLPPPPPNLS